MDKRMKEKLSKQTVKIRDANKNPTGSGFFIKKNMILTVEHCVPKDEEENFVNEISFSIGGGQEFISGITCNRCGRHIVLIILWDIPSVEEAAFFSLGYYDNFSHGEKVDIYGYPRQGPMGYPLSIEIGQSVKEEGGVEDKPTLICFVRNTPGGLDTYEGLSGSPVVYQNHIVGMVTKEDEGGTEPNAIYLLDFSLYKDTLPRSLKLLEVVQKKRKKLDRMALYSQAWWLRRPYDQEQRPMVMDRYSIVLASMLLGMEGSANVILASPWEDGLADALQDETAFFEERLSVWGGRQWTECADGDLPDWSKLADNAGVVIDIFAKDQSGNLILQALKGREEVQKNILLLFNIYSLDAEEAIVRALEEAKGVGTSVNYDLLTVSVTFGVLDKEDISSIVSTHDLAKVWLEERGEKFFCGDMYGGNVNPKLWELLDSDGINALAWEVSCKYRGEFREEWRDVFDCFWRECSESMKELITYTYEEQERPDLNLLDLWDLRRWFCSLDKDECKKYIASLHRDHAKYWTAILSNPYCTEYVLQEMSESKKNLIAKRILNQELDDCNDIVLKEMGDYLRRQIRRYF